MSEVRFKVLCSKTSKQHVIGRIVETPVGDLLTLTVELQHPGRRSTGLERTFARDDERSAGAWPAWCARCEKAHPVAVPADFFRAMDAGREAVVLTAEGTWTDPVGVLDRRDAQP